ncbi:Callose synthase 9 [Vitis vinifera]|uniref:Callose synthase 9 n=1 Tax=Vitis vinifera TaxID=29760 RepID=A0A438ELW3_VITVI|nr:Callose synthase 9 [Vitis vinifera]
MRVYRDEKDKVLCIESKSGKFLELGDLVSFLMSVIWSSHMPPTVSFFAWKLKRVMESDAAMTEDLIAYNIIPLDAPTITNAIVSFPEVQAAVSALKYFKAYQNCPGTFLYLRQGTLICLIFCSAFLDFRFDSMTVAFGVVSSVLILSDLCYLLVLEFQCDIV